MATILDIKPVERVVKVDKLSDINKSELLTFLGIMREKKEYEKLKAMKEVADAKYKVKSFSRQVREIEKNIAKVKDDKRIKTFYIPEPIPIPLAKEMAKSIPIPSATIESTPAPLFIKSNVLQNQSPYEIPDIRVPKKMWQCEKCNIKPFTAKKLLKLHISESHSY